VGVVVIVDQAGGVLVAHPTVAAVARPAPAVEQP